MDIGELLKDYIWVILAVLFYLFAGRKKKNKGKKEEPVARPVPRTEPSAKPGLQERLEQALREMQERSEQESRTQPVQSSAQSAPQMQVKESAPIVPAVEATVVEPAPARNPFEFTSTMPLHQRRTALDVAFQSDSAEASIEVSKPERFSGFKEGHGLRYHTHADEMAKTARAEFHEAHGLHYGDSLLAPSSRGGAPIQEEEAFQLFRNEDDIRRAIIATEILGPPRSVRR